ncbi:MAG: 30S ribosomal protein S8 [Candidatus Omnitrophica bacterium]|nr:30S ribosomal protein S8 [Candidatus Omnitrophota bacterium]
MSLNDPLSDLLVSVQNASLAGKPHVEVPASRLGLAVVEVLKSNGFIQNWRKITEGSPQGRIRVYLKYTKDRKPILRKVRRVSRPGLRIYVPKNKVPRVFSGIGIAIVSTPQGVFSGQEAKARGVGGELLCKVW